MVTDARGSHYDPVNPPHVESRELAGVVNWLTRELARISNAQHVGRAEMLSLDVMSALPAKPFEGLVGWFKAGVAGAGAGLYEYRGGAWAKL